MSFNKDGQTYSGDGGEREQTFKAVKKEVLKYVVKDNGGKGKELPFTLGNKDASKFKSSEEDYIKNTEIGLCNAEISQKEIDFKKLTIPATPPFPFPFMSCPDYVDRVIEEHPGGYFRHAAYNWGSYGRFTEFFTDLYNEAYRLLNEGKSFYEVKKQIISEIEQMVKANPFEGCYEEHRINEGVTGIRKVGECHITVEGINAVPEAFRLREIPLLGCFPLCKQWTIISDKIEYYLPTHKITLSREPLYSRYLDKEVAEKMFDKYQTAVESEIRQQTMASKDNQYLLDTIQNLPSNVKGNKSGINRNASNERKVQPEKLQKTAFLGQIDRGYARIFKFDNIEDEVSKAVWTSGEFAIPKPILPHVSEPKGYWGTDFDDNMNNSFFNEQATTENLAYYTIPSKSYKGNAPKEILKEYAKEHIKAPWDTVKRDGTVGGSYQFGTQMKADPALHKKGELLNYEKLFPNNTYVRNRNAYGSGNISNLHAQVSTGNSDYIIQTLVKAHNRFIAEVPTEAKLPFLLEDKIKQDYAPAKFCSNEGLNDPQLVPNSGLGNIVTVTTAPGRYFYNTVVIPTGNRQTYKSMYDLFHCPVIKDDNGEKYPKSFNEDFNKDVENILNNKAKRETVIKANGQKCFKMSDLMANNLDYNLINTLTNKYNNIETVANKGEISFTQYTLYTGALAFPGMTCKFWWNGIGLEGGLTGKGMCKEVAGSKATPKLGPAEFRLF